MTCLRQTLPTGTSALGEQQRQVSVIPCMATAVTVLRWRWCDIGVQRWGPRMVGERQSPGSPVPCRAPRTPSVFQSCFACSPICAVRDLISFPQLLFVGCNQIRFLLLAVRNPEQYGELRKTGSRPFESPFPGSLS